MQKEESLHKKRCTKWMYTPNRLNYHLLEKDIINFLNEVGEEFFKYYDVRNLVEDFVYVYNCDIDDMEKELRQLKIKKKN